ncbi:MAG: hypothetical protein K9M03_04640 [Kiritimatiellales bacterium]|nr:hypothetical protein [Kiritimatiellales bacterium]
MKILQSIFVCLMVLFCVDAYGASQIHMVIATESDNPALTKRITGLFSDNVDWSLELGLCLSVKQIKDGTVTLVVQHGHNELSHWMANDPAVLRYAVAHKTHVGTLFLDPDTRKKILEQLKFLFQVSHAVEQYAGVQRVRWCEMDFQKKLCPICEPTVATEWRPGYSFHYPQNLGTEAFLGMLTSLNITLAMPLRDSDKLQLLPSYSYGQRVTIIDPGPRYIERVLIWNSHYREGSVTKLALLIGSEETAYAPSRSILERSGLWDNGVTKQEIVHLYSDEMNICLEHLWRERWEVDRANFPDLTYSQLSRAEYGFRQKEDGKWEIYLQKLTYD